MSSPFEGILETFGITRMPWVIRVYLLLLLLCVALLIFAVYQTPANLTEGSSHPAVKLFSLATDTLKLVLGALLGSVSLAASSQWGEGKVKPITDPAEHNSGVPAA